MRPVLQVALDLMHLRRAEEIARDAVEGGAAEHRARLEEHPGDLAAGVSEAVQYMVTAARDNPLLETIITRAAAGGDVSLLSLLTVRGEALLGTATALVGDWVSGQWPSADPADVRLMVESVVRLCQSHILTPTKDPAEVGADLARVACRCLPLPD